MRTVSSALGALAAAAVATSALAQDAVKVGQLVDYTGPTSFVGTQYGPGVTDALAYINSKGGVGGVMLDVDTVDYAYKVPEAVGQYRRWQSGGMVAMQGWGTADTEALISFVAKDQVPVWSASYSAHLTDPLGANPKTERPAPFNFFYGPSYSDACRALVQWAWGDAQEKGIEKPIFIHTGDNHPYPNAPKEACAEYAAELGFTVAPPVVVPLAPGDFRAQCLTIRESGAQYVYMGNLGGSIVSLLNSCDTAGVEATYMGNPWAGDHLTVKAAEAKGIVFPTSTPFYGADVPGMALVKEIVANGGGLAGERPTHHYLRGVCSAYYMVEAMAMAAEKGEVTGLAVRDAMYERQDWVPAGLEGVCLPSTWSKDDHRGLMTIAIQRGSFVDGEVVIEEIAQVELERRPDWLGR